MGQLVDALQEGLQAYLTATFVDRGSRESMSPQHLRPAVTRAPKQIAPKSPGQAAFPELLCAYHLRKPGLSGQVKRGRSTWRRSTASCWRRTTISASLDSSSAQWARNMPKSPATTR